MVKAALLYVRDTFIQTLVLFLKNKVLLARRWSSTSIIVLSPLIIIFLLWILGVLIGLSSSSYTQVGAWQLRTEKSTLAKCVSWGKVPCYLLAYTTNNSPFGERVMSYVIQNYTSDPANEVKRFDYTVDLNDFLKNNPNRTLTAVSWSNVTTTAPIYPASKNFTNIAYTLYYNSTSNGGSAATTSSSSSSSSLSSFNTGDLANQLLDWQVIIDNAILYHRGLDLGINLPEKVIDKVYAKGFPKVPLRPNGQISILAVTGPQFFSLSMMIILVVCLNSIVLEKEHKLRFGMVMMGLRNSAYWISWFLTFMFVGLIQTLLTIGIGAAFQIYIFLYTDFWALFLTFYIFSLCLICLAFLLSAFISTSKTALIFGFILLAFSYILNLVVASSFIIPNLYIDSVPKVLPILLHLYPPYNFALVFADMLTKAAPTFDSAAQTYLYNNRYYFGDLFLWTGKTDQVPPSAIALAVLIAQGVVLLILAWYMDNVFASSSGQSRSFLFFLSPSYWGCTCFKRRRSGQMYQLPQDEIDKMDPDLRKEYENARDHNRPAAIRITGLKKTYQTLWSCITGSSVHAVRGLDLCVEEGTCFAMLGHNGAGKTTTISILQGLNRATSGDAEIFGTSVHDEVDQVRRVLGVCPQHDILWSDLTAREHLFLFSVLKGVSYKELWGEISERLRDVGLFRVGNHVAGSYSGGMKRRLSVAISCIGNPKVILMDEPTTGMDPFNRRQVWSLIIRMKANRVILLTTHSMEEADALADRLAIMASGRIQCIGDTIHLKHKFGTGYNLCMTVDTQNEQQVDQLVMQMVPEAVRISSNAGNIMYGIPQQLVAQLSVLVEKLEKWEKEPNCAVREWSLSDTTLEEVYLKVTKKADFGFSDLKSKSNPPPVNPSESQQQPPVPSAPQVFPALNQVQPELHNDSIVDQNVEQHQ